MKESWEQMVEAIEKSTTVKTAAMKLIEDMGQRLEAIADHPTPAEVRELAQKLKQHADALATAVDEHEQ